MSNKSSFNLKRFFLLSGLAVSVLLVGSVIELRAKFNRVANAYSLTHKLRPEDETLTEIRYHAVEIQQFLTDASATAAKDGFDGAAKHYRDAKRLLDNLQAINADWRPDVIELQKMFDDTYSTGVQMAHAYIDHGQAAGNQIMRDPTEGFDWRCQVLTRRLEALVSQVRMQLLKNHQDLDSAVNLQERALTGISALLLGGVLGLFWMVYRRLVSIIGAEPIQAQKLLLELAKANPLSNAGDESDIVSLTHSIEHLISDRERALHSATQAQQAAESASRAKSAFLANMSHEIRTPMNGVIGMTELALATELTPIQRDYLNIVRSSAESLLAVINDILDFSKIEAGKLDIEHVSFSLRTCIRETMVILAQRASERSLQMHCEIDEDIQDQLMGDPVRFRQVLTNLFSNAIKFSERGKIVLSVKRQGEYKLYCSVTDTGIGIASDKLDQVFQSFSQADSSTTRRFGGTGLGLTICKQLVELMGGEIGVHSQLGIGSCFYFTINYEVESVPVLPPATSAPQFHGKRVLIVEDSIADQRWLATLLGKWALQVDVADSGSQARKLMATNQYALALLDLHLPDESGFDLLPWLVAQQENCSVIVISAAATPECSARCRASGALTLLHKPVTASELLDALSECPALHTRAAAATTAHTLSSQTATRSLHVLIAEDNLVNQMLAQALLEQMGYTSVVADDGAEALRICMAENFDLVLMDMHMPEMNGMEATSAIRAHEAEHNLPRLPIIALTANAMREAIDECYAAGMDGYVSKPINRELLVAEIVRCTEVPLQISAVS